MTNPSNSLWLAGAACCLAPLLCFGLGFLVATIHYKGWIKVHVDTTKAPKLNWRRNT
jgi:hypothetical protein